MKFSLATLVTYFLVCLITAEDHEAGNTKTSWSSRGASRPDTPRPATLANDEPATYSTPTSWPTAVQPPGGRKLTGTKGRPGPYYEEGYYAGSRKTLFGKGGRWRGPRCAVVPPSEECTGGITMWFYDPENKTCAAHEVGNCFRLGFFFCRVCVASCMGIFWRRQEIQDICQLSD
uniref:Pancreatic trypsin inhibitor n=1 Tax=Rhipicephalus pulchellus TaxID=72859 RepID=L7MA25_RHIPC